MTKTNPSVPPPDAREQGAGPVDAPRDALAVPQPMRRLARMGRSFLCALAAPAASPCPHRRDGTLCPECAWQWSTR